jgi:hypothetical protein
MANVLSLCQDAATESRLSRPEAVAGVTDDERAVLLARALTKTCTQLQDDNWQKLIREKTFTTVAAETQTDTPLPTDFLRFVKTRSSTAQARQRVFGPLSDEMAEHQGDGSYLGATISSAFAATRGLMTPTPTAGQTIAYEYVTSDIGTDVTARQPSARVHRRYRSHLLGRRAHGTRHRHERARHRRATTTPRRAINSRPARRRCS